MKKFIITEDERSRILGMHKTATSRHYLNEQTVPVTTNTTTVANPNTKTPVTTNTTTVANPNTNFEDWFKKQNIKMPKAKREITISATESSTLESIAKEHGVTVADILKDNPGKTNDNLKPGETLCFQGYDIEM